MYASTTALMFVTERVTANAVTWLGPVSRLLDHVGYCLK